MEEKQVKYAYRLVRGDPEWIEYITLFHTNKYSQTGFESIVFEAAKRVITDIELPKWYKYSRKWFEGDNDFMREAYKDEEPCGAIDWNEICLGVVDILLAECGFVKEDIEYCATVGEGIDDIGDLFYRDHREPYHRSERLEYMLRAYIFKQMYDADIKP